MYQPTNHAEHTRNVLVAVDPQRDFIDGSLAVKDGDQVIAPLNDIAREVRHTDGAVVFTRDWHPQVTPHFDQWPVHCVQNTEGASYPAELVVDPTDVIVSKGMGQEDGYSGMEGSTDDGMTLEQIVEPQNPHERVRIFVGGLATDFCVKATALDLATHFDNDPRATIILIRDAIRAVNLQPQDGETAIQAMTDAGIQAMTTQEIKAAFFENEGLQL